MLPAVIGAIPTLVVGAGTVIVAVYAARLANSYRRQLDLKTSDRRLDAYAALWSHFLVAAPTRRTPMTEAERLKLYDEMTGWYYLGGNGMLLTALTRQVYLKAKENLRCRETELFPSVLAAEAPLDPTQRDTWRGKLSQDQLSLLRTQMKSDLAITGKVFSGELSDRDVAFLNACGADTNKEPWAVAGRARPRSARSDGPSDTHNASSIATLWEEYKYRHDLIWRLLFRITAVATVLSVVPFTIDELTEQRAGFWLSFLPFLGLVLVLVAWPVMIFELRLFEPIDLDYRTSQARALGKPPVTKPKVDLFRTIVIIYPGLLAGLVAIAASVVWTNR